VEEARDLVLEIAPGVSRPSTNVPRRFLTDRTCSASVGPSSAVHADEAQEPSSASLVTSSGQSMAGGEVPRRDRGERFE